MRRTASSLLAFCLVGGTAFGQTSPLDAPPPRELIAQVDDSDLREEETLEELQQDEYDKSSQSMAAAIGLSLLPGGGWGLVYADKGAQSTVPFLITLAGVGLGIAGYVGAFDEGGTDSSCLHVRDGEVPVSECTLHQDKVRNKEVDPRDLSGRQYFETVNDYELIAGKEPVDNSAFGTYFLLGGYGLAALVGAVWAAIEVADHNERLRKDIESTVEGPSWRPTPVVVFDGDNGMFGFSLAF